MLDLHLHSTASDGEATLVVLEAALTARPDAELVALCDHDTLGVAPDWAARDPRVWIGAELTSVVATGRMDLLALNLDPASAPLLAYLAARTRERRERFALFGELLRAESFVFEPTAETLAQPQLAQPHVVRELRRHPANMARLAALGVPLSWASQGDDPIYARLLDRFSADIKARSELSVGAAAELIALIHGAGGLAVIAHPWINLYDFGRRDPAIARAIIGELAAAGLDGLEVYHPDHDATAVAELQEMARELDMLTTAGSDDHSPDAGRLGSTWPGPGVVSDLAALRTAAAGRCLAA